MANSELEERARQAYVSHSLARVFRLDDFWFKNITGAELFWEMWSWFALCVIISTTVAWIFFFLWIFY